MITGAWLTGWLKLPDGCGGVPEYCCDGVVVFQEAVDCEGCPLYGWRFCSCRAKAPWTVVLGRLVTACWTMGSKGAPAPALLLVPVGCGTDGCGTGRVAAGMGGIGGGVAAPPAGIRGGDGIGGVKLVMPTG